MNFKKMTLGVLCSLSLILAGCSSATPFANRDGSILTYDKVENLEDGYYVVKANGKVNPLLSEGVQGNETTNAIVWFTDFDKLIPVYDQGDRLIIVESDGFENNKPVNFVKLRDSGWTIGATFNMNLTRNTEGKVKNNIQFSGNFSPYSQAGAAVNAVMGSNSSAYLLDINGQDFTSNMLSSNGILQGLTKDAMYQFRYYVGTKYQFINMKADTHVFEGERLFTSSEFIEEKSNYFTVPIPEGLEKGYYIVNGFGMFYYNAGEFSR